MPPSKAALSSRSASEPSYLHQADEVDGLILSYGQAIVESSQFGEQLVQKLVQ